MTMLKSKFLVVVLSLLVASNSLPAKEKRDAKFNNKKIDESSGVVKSSLYKGVYWTHNDSGDKARIFAFDEAGKSIYPKGGKNRGVKIEGANNVDWEDIAYDGDGNLVIADVGNNHSSRKDLTIYVLKEPNPREERKAKVLNKFNVHYEDQNNFQRRKDDFDCEAIFYRNKKLHLLTKNRKSNKVHLYVLNENVDLTISNKLTKLETFDVKNQVTAADISKDGKWLAILTYDAVWMVSVDPDKESVLSGQKYRYALQGTKQCEAICFDGKSVMITNEQSEVFTVLLETIRLPKYLYKLKK